MAPKPPTNGRKLRTPPEIVFPGELLERPEDAARQAPREAREDLTRDLLESLCADARRGSARRTAALANGVRPELFEFWLINGMNASAPPLMRELAVRFPAETEIRKIELLDVANTAAVANPGLAIDLLKLADPLYRGEAGEPDLTPAQLSPTQEYERLVEALRQPDGELARAMREAGVLAQPTALVLSTSEEP